MAIGFKLRINGGVLVDSVTDVGETTTHDFTGLSADTEYAVELADYDTSDPDGTMSEWSEIVRATTEAGPGAISLRINCGKTSTQGRWVDQTAYVTAGTPFDNNITGYYVLNVPQPGHAENDIYSSGQRGAWKYTFNGLDPGTACLVRVHHHDYDSGTGVFAQSVKANSVTKLAEYDLGTFDTGHRADIKEFTVTPDGGGSLVIEGVPASGKEGNVNLLEIRQPAPSPGYRMIHACGDSTTSGIGSEGTLGSYPRQIGRNIDASVYQINYTEDFNGYDETRPYTIHIHAQPGTLIETQTGFISSFITPQAYTTWEKNIVTLMCGVNNIGAATDDAPTIIGKLTDFFDGLPAGVTHKVICKILPAKFVNDNPGFVSVWNDVNDWIEANTEGYDVVVDFVASDSRLGDPTDLTYWNSDNLHPNEAGHSLMAAVLQPILLAL